MIGNPTTILILDKQVYNHASVFLLLCFAKTNCSAGGCIDDIVMSSVAKGLVTRIGKTYACIVWLR